MFSFDGSYRRTPVQSLGGASRSSDRDTLIRKAAEERQKRADVRRQNNGATMIQSYARSFILRQRVKREQRGHFDAMLATRGALNDQTLELVLRRILFFYYGGSRDDGQRLILLGQHILRAPAFLLTKSVTDRVWRHRLRRLLQLCTRQICLQQHLSASIPFRMLETFTTAEHVERHVPDSAVVLLFLEDIYAHLVRGDYFRLLRQMLDDKVPPLDGCERRTAPNAISDTLLQMLMQPLRLVDAAPAASTTACNRLILASFVEHILLPAYTDPVRYFVLPCLAQSAHFPFVALLRYLDGALAYRRDADGDEGVQAMDATTTTAATTIPTTTETATTTAAAAAPSSSSTGTKALCTSPFLLHALLTLDHIHQPRLLAEPPLLAAYIRCIAAMSSHLSRLPASKRSAAVAAARLRLAGAEVAAVAEAADEMRNDLDAMSTDDVADDAVAAEDGNAHIDDHVAIDGDDGDDDDDDDDADGNEQMGAGLRTTPLETEVLLGVVAQLNDATRTRLIADHVEELFLGEPEVLHCVCQICHHLMLYNRVAQRDYRLLSRLYFKPKFIRTLWVTLATQSSQLRFSSPLSLLSRGIYIRKG